MAQQKLRIHTLAKELQVPSKIIIDKCQKEGIDVKNHMHVLTAGLEATLREWFSEGAHTTTIEDTDRVDLKRVRVRKKKATVAGPAGDESSSKTDVMVAEEGDQPAEWDADDAGGIGEVSDESLATLTITEAADSATGELVTVSGDQSQDISESITSDQPEAGDADVRTLAAEAPATEQIAQPTDSPDKSADEKKPLIAGPQNVPAPAKLTGPRVIRIDRAEQDYRPPRPARPAARSTGWSGGLPRPGLVEDPDAAARQARKPQARAGEREGPEGEEAGPAADKKRAHPRRGFRDTTEVASEQLKEWRDRDLIERRDRLAQASGRGIGGLKAIEGKQSRRSMQRGPIQQHTKKDCIELVEPIVVKDLSREAGIPVNEIVKKLMRDKGELANINTVLDAEMAELICAEYEIEVSIVKARSGLEKLHERFEAMERKHLKPRPPVVTVLGHVDHGKTSLLDRIRDASVAAGEAGGITQHIGAYRVKVDDKWVTFLDTPGHTAFTAMRARGASVTDVVVLVVAADDGVMPTTVEAINHAKAAGTTIVVALNKIDLPHDINKIYGQLAEQGLTPSGDWGGSTDVVKTSAVTGEGIKDLLSHLATLSELMNWTADPTLPARGAVIEAEMDEKIGNLARVLVQEGTLHKGDFVVCGACHGRVRALKDENGRMLKEAGPSTPVEVFGLNGVPSPGDPFYAVSSAQQAKEIGEEAAALRREQALFRSAKPTTLESALANAAEGEIPELSVIVRADVHGSVEVLKKALSEFPSDQVKLDILHAGVGNVTESDVVLAQASNAIIVAFYVVPEPSVQKMADDCNVSIRSYRVIYDVLDDIRKALEDRLDPEEKLETRGRAEVREVFGITRVGKVAGCIVRDGVIGRNHKVRIIRDGVAVKEGIGISSLRRFKDDVREVKSGLECGVFLANYADVKPGDILEAYEVIEVARTLD